jgi:hypothetical protein
MASSIFSGLPFSLVRPFTTRGQTMLPIGRICLATSRGALKKDEPAPQAEKRGHGDLAGTAAFAHHSYDSSRAAGPAGGSPLADAFFFRCRCQRKMAKTITASDTATVRTYSPFLTQRAIGTP